MKKILSVALALVLGLSSFAQFSSKPVCHDGSKTAAKTLPTWTAISQDVTGTNFLNSSETISTAAIRAQGKAMVIDFSATWCTWCWVMHTNGILEAIQSQLGNDVEVIWVEADPSTTDPAEITGSGSTQGDWTNNGSVPYPIINDANFANIIGGSNVISGYPTVVFVSPSGYWCDVYGTEWGFGPYNSSEAVSAISALLNAYPQPNTAPTVEINGFNNVLVNSTASFSANIVSVDSILSIEWDFSDGTPATATTATATTTWNTTGTRTISCTVTNTTGSTTATLSVNVFDWNWGDEMSYCGDADVYSSVGLSGNGDIQWGIMIPSRYLANRNYLNKVSAYISNPGTYEVLLYKGGDNAPQTLICQYTYNVPASAVDSWYDFPIYNGPAVDATQNLWVVMHTNGVNYPASYTTFVGDPNGSWICYNGAWYAVYDLSASLQSTWMISVTTSAVPPALAVNINGPASGLTDSPITFTAAGDPAATYSWTLNDATPATATGQTATVSWDVAGTYTVSVTATRGTETASASATITIEEPCSADLDYTMGFESSDDISCMQFVDNDGDGYGWEAASNTFGSDYAHTGSDAMASASYINSLGALSPDNWMITPKLHIPAGGATLEWWSGAVDENWCSDHYSVLLSTTGMALASFTTTLYDGENESAAYTHHSVNLADYDEQDVFIAFRHNDHDIYWMLIDDISVSRGLNGIDNAETVRVSISPNPATDRVVVKADNVQTVEVYDVTGAKVLTTNSHVVDMSALSNGVYMFRVSTANGVSNQKVVKQ